MEVGNSTCYLAPLGLYAEGHRIGARVQRGDLNCGNAFDCFWHDTQKPNPSSPTSTTAHPDRSLSFHPPRESQRFPLRLLSGLVAVLYRERHQIESRGDGDSSHINSSFALLMKTRAHSRPSTDGLPDPWARHKIRPPSSSSQRSLPPSCPPTLFLHCDDLEPHSQS